MQQELQKVCLAALSGINPKQGQVLARRFGLLGANYQTLQEIGDDLKITRERIRQIERDGLKKLKNQEISPNLKTIFITITNYLEKQGGAKREDLLLADLAKNDLDKNCVYFLLTISPAVERVAENELVYPYWVQDKEVKNKIEQYIKQVSQKLSAENKPLNKAIVFKLVSSGESALFNSALEIAKQIEQGPLKEYGLRSWAEIKPRGVRDAIYLVLNHYKKPLHFNDIANLSNSLGENGVFQNKKVLPQTAHNELIRDPRFVLVGRGLYALKEWGFAAGPVKDTLKTILATSARPLTKQEIIEQMRTKKVVKVSTITLNLSDKKVFAKTPDGKYSIKTA